MISAEPDFDREMVRNYIQERGLDPVPDRQKPHKTVKTGDVMLGIETYAWGRVFYARVAERELGLTWIEEEGQELPFLPPWVDEVRARVDRPECLGWHEEDHVCDGGKNEVGEKEPPCAWRDRCLVVKGLAGATPTIGKVSAVLVSHQDEELDTRTDKAVLARKQKAKPLPKEAVFAASETMMHRIVDDVMARIDGTLAKNQMRAKEGAFYLRLYQGTTPTSSRKWVLFERSVEHRAPRSIVTFDIKRTEMLTIELRTDEIDVAKAMMDGTSVWVKLGGTRWPFLNLHKVYPVDIDRVVDLIVHMLVANLFKSHGLPDDHIDTAYGRFYRRKARPWTIT